MTVVQNGGRGVGPEAEGDKYPLANPSDDVKGLLADFYLSHDVRDAVLPLRISWIYGLCGAQGSCGSSSDVPGGPVPTHEADVLVLDADDKTVFDSTAASLFRVRDWGPRLRLYDWTSGNAVCRLLAHRGAGEAEDAATFPTEIHPVNAILDERTHDVVPRRVDSVTVNGVAFSEPFELIAGYNTTVEVSTLSRTRRGGRKLTLSAVPGAGLGRYPACVEPDVVIRRVNGVAPDENGNLAIAVAGRGDAPPCLWLERPVDSYDGGVAVVRDAALRLNDDCGPCCSCDDYVDTYRGVRRLYSRYRELGVRAEQTRNDLAGVIDQYVAAKNCQKANDTTFLKLFALGDGVLEVRAGFTNFDPQCKYDAALELRFSATDGVNTPGIQLSGSTFVSTPDNTGELKDLSGTWPVYVNRWDFVGPSTAVSFAARFRFSFRLGGGSVTVTATPTVSGVAYPAATRTAGLIP